MVRDGLVNTSEIVTHMVPLSQIGKSAFRCATISTIRQSMFWWIAEA